MESRGQDKCREEECTYVCFDIATFKPLNMNIYIDTWTIETSYTIYAAQDGDLKVSGCRKNQNFKKNCITVGYFHL